MARIGTYPQHKAKHQDGGIDEVSVAALSGLLAADQHVLDAEVLAVAAALVHAARHQNTGADQISVAGLSGALADDQHVLDAEVVAVALALAGGVMAGNIVLNNTISLSGKNTAGTAKKLISRDGGNNCLINEDVEGNTIIYVNTGLFWGVYSVSLTGYVFKVETDGDVFTPYIPAVV